MNSHAGCANTMIGNELLRGVSGGEKKRVTVGEGLITNARFLALDEISTGMVDRAYTAMHAACRLWGWQRRYVQSPHDAGLDSSVTFDIVRSLRTRARNEHVGIIIALLQVGAPSTSVPPCKVAE